MYEARHRTDDSPACIHTPTMNAIMHPRKRSIFTGTLLYSLSLLLVLAAPVLGLAASSVAAWNSLLAGSVLYMPLGLVLLLAVVAVVHTHKAFDITLLALVGFGVTTWFLAGAVRQIRLLDAVQTFAAQTPLMIGALLVMVVVLVLVRATRRSGGAGAVSG